MRLLQSRNVDTPGTHNPSLRSGDGGNRGQVPRVLDPASLGMVLEGTQNSLPRFSAGTINPLSETCENGCKFRRRSVMGGRTLRMYNMNKGHSLALFPLLPRALLATLALSHARKNVS